MLRKRRHPVKKRRCSLLRPRGRKFFTVFLKCARNEKCGVLCSPCLATHRRHFGLPHDPNFFRCFHVVTRFAMIRDRQRDFQMRSSEKTSRKRTFVARTCKFSRTDRYGAMWYSRISFGRSVSLCSRSLPGSSLFFPPAPPPPPPSEDCIPVPESSVFVFTENFYADLILSPPLLKKKKKKRRSFIQPSRRCVRSDHRARIAFVRRSSPATRPRPSTGIAPAACTFALDPPSPRTGARARKLRSICNACPKSRGDRGNVRWRALAGVDKLPTRIVTTQIVTDFCDDSGGACDGCKKSDEEPREGPAERNRARRIHCWPNAIPMTWGTKTETGKT